MILSTRPAISRSAPDLALIAVTGIWGSTFLLVQTALSFASPLIFLVLRFGLASAVLAIMYRRKLVRSSFVPGAVTGIFLFGGYAFQTAGLQFTSASNSAFLTSLSVPMVPFLSALVYRTKPGRLELLGVLVASAGMVLLTFPGRLIDVSRGDWLSLLCAISFAGQIVALGHHAGRGNFETLVTSQMITVTGLALLTFWWVEKPVFRPSPGLWLAVAVSALLATVLAFSVQAWAQQYLSVTRAALIYALEPVFAWLTTYLLTGMPLTSRFAAGAVLIVFGILIVELKRVNGPEHRMV